MGITLIVTKSIDRKFKPTDQRIALDDWLAIIKKDPELRLNEAPSISQLGSMTIEVPAQPGQSELLANGIPTWFLGFRKGELVMRYSEAMDDPDDLARRKIAEVARQIGALITHDAGDRILAW